MNPKRIYMNVEGASPGGGAVPPAPAAPAATDGGAQPPAGLTAADIKSVVTETFTELRNGLFADFRKAGAFKQEKPTEATQATAQPTAASASTGLSAADVEAMLRTERVITRAATERKLTDAQTKRLESAVRSDRPDDVTSYVSTWLSDMGLDREPAPSTTTVTQQPTVTVTASQPISDKGSPAPAGVLDYERELAENPIGMSPAARQRMDAKYGVEKGRAMRLEAARAQAERIRVTKPTG